MDRPDRARRFARWVGTLDSSDTIYILGDLCDFWMATRCREAELLQCPGIQALLDFRSRGGALATMPGNHDLWLCPFYERALGATTLTDPVDMTIQGLRLHLVHGHLLGARRRWKAIMESHEFFKAFTLMPPPVAGMLDKLLERKNQKDLEEDERRHLIVFRQYAAGRQGQTDLVVIGHVHRAVDDAGSDPRMIVLGGWHKRSSYLCIDAAGASFHLVADDPLEVLSPGLSSSLQSTSEPSCPTP
jgi:UDP-2,3-diacylglucosamine hydrolase